MNAAKQVEKLILELVLSDNYQPLKPKAIAKKLKLLDEEREVKRTIKRLIKKGRLAYGPKHLVIRCKQKPLIIVRPKPMHAKKISPAVFAKILAALASSPLKTRSPQIVPTTSLSLNRKPLMPQIAIS